MQIFGLQPSQALQGLTGAGRVAAAEKPAAAQSASAIPADQLDLSEEAQSLSAAQASGGVSASDDVRWEKVNALREAIAGGGYDSPERMSAALDKLLDAYA
jgi:negative regulator of flagellin synthesis FlgM